MSEAKTVLPMLIAFFIALSGALLLSLSLLGADFFSPQPPGKYVLMGLSAAFVLAGAYFAVMAYRGELKRRGKSIFEVRKEAVEKLKDPILLKKIAADEEEPEEIRALAQERVKEFINAKT